MFHVKNNFIPNFPLKTHPRQGLVLSHVDPEKEVLTEQNFVVEFPSFASKSFKLQCQGIDWLP